MANCSPSEGNAGTVEQGSGTVKIGATTMTQVAHKEGKRWGMEEGKDRWRGSDCPGTNRLDIAAGPDRQRPRILPLAAAG